MAKINLHTYIAILIFLSIPSIAMGSEAQQNRGLFAFINRGVVQVSWRMRASDDPKETRYLLFCGPAAKTCNTLIGTYTTKTTVRLPKTIYENKYFKIVVQDKDGKVIDSQDGVKATAKPYLDIPLETPEAIMDSQADTVLIKYSPGDCSTYDMDGDGEQEIILKWMPSPLVKTTDGQTYYCHQYMDCYKLPSEGSGQSAKRLWRIDVGPNVVMGNNFPFFCWDYDGDGKGEMIIRTAPGTKDATGTYVGSASHSATGYNLPGYDTDLNSYYQRGSTGNPTRGEEWVTIFSYEGKELCSRQYWPYFNIVEDWDDRSGSTDSYDYGHRGNAFKGGVMKIPCNDGVVRPTACFERGIYSYVYCTDYSWNGKTLEEEWRNASTKNTGLSQCSYRECNGITSYQDISLYSQGAHPSAVADIDGDGYDELIIGAAALDHDGTVLWSTGLGHGDAIHIGELNINNPGLEVFRITEASTKYDACIIDGKTGNILNGQLFKSGDVGRGIAMDIDPDYPGCEYMFHTSGAVYNQDGDSIYSKNLSNNGMENYRILWDGDLMDEHLSGNKIAKFSTSTHSFGRLLTLDSRNTDGTNYHCNSINSSKENPCLQCDLLGDFREELVYFVTGNSDTSIPNEYGLRVVTSCYDTNYKLPWLMDDNTYAKEVACQNCGYSMPPHLGYNALYYHQQLNMPDQKSVEFVPHEGMSYYILCDNLFMRPSELYGTFITLSDTPDTLTFEKNSDGYKIKVNGQKYLAVNSQDTYGFTLNDTGTSFMLTTNNDGTVNIQCSGNDTSTTYLQRRVKNNAIQDHLIRSNPPTGLNIVQTCFATDVNANGKTDIDDVNTILDTILGKQHNSRADTNNDGKVDISDITNIISTMNE